MQLINNNTAFIVYFVTSRLSLNTHSYVTNATSIISSSAWGLKNATPLHNVYIGSTVYCYIAHDYLYAGSKQRIIFATKY